MDRFTREQEGSTVGGAAQVVVATCIMALAIGGSIPDGWRALIGIIALLAFAYALNGRRPSQRPAARRHWKQGRRHRR